MKKLLVTLLVLAMFCSMVACGGNKNKESEIMSDNIEDGFSEEQETSVDVFGEVEGDTYTNRFLDLGFTLPEGWSFYTKEQINELNGRTQDLLEEESAKQIEEGKVIIDMYAQDQYGNNVNLTIGKVSSLAPIPTNLKKYAENSVTQIIDALTQAGASEVTAEVTTSSFVGKEHVSIDVACMVNDIPLYEKVINLGEGQYMVGIAATTLQQDTTDTILSCFYSLEK